MRARYPDVEGVVERDGGRVAYEVYGAGDPPIVFVPPWQIVHLAIWKAQIPDFARRHLVVAWDNRGNGRSDRPTDPLAHTTRARAGEPRGGDGRGRRPRRGARRALVVLRADDPVRRRASRARPRPRVRLPGVAVRGARSVVAGARSRTGWRTTRAGTRRTSTSGVATTGPTSSSSSAEAFSEPHSTKQIEDGVGYGLDTDPESLATTKRAPPTLDLETFTAMCGGIRAPTLVIQGTDDRITDVSQGVGLARAIPGARLELLEGGGHIVHARDPVRVNLLIRDFVAAGDRDVIASAPRIGPSG